MHILAQMFFRGLVGLLAMVYFRAFPKIGCPTSNSLSAALRLAASVWISASRQADIGLDHPHISGDQKQSRAKYDFPLSSDGARYNYVVKFFRSTTCSGKIDRAHV